MWLIHVSVTLYLLVRLSYVYYTSSTIAAGYSFQEVCHPYWPNGKGSSESYSKYQVTLKTQENSTDFIIRKMEISDSQAVMSVNQNGFTVTQFQYVRWPENGVPQSTTGVLEMANLVQKVQMGSGNKAIVVMCK